MRHTPHSRASIENAAFKAKRDFVHFILDSFDAAPLDFDAKLTLMIARFAFIDHSGILIQAIIVKDVLRFLYADAHIFVLLTQCDAI